MTLSVVIVISCINTTCQQSFKLTTLLSLAGERVSFIMLDISAAFDMLDHDRFLQRATDMFGLDGTVKNWLRSYLTGRRSYVACGQHHSSIVTTSTGVPQGSVLGPLLFTIFTTPVGHLISSLNVISSVRRRYSVVYLY